MLQIAEQDAGLPSGLLQAIVAVESRGRSYVVNHKTHDYGLMQINAVVGQRMGYRPEQLLDAQTSVQVAVKLLMYKRKRFGHEQRWECRYNVGTAKAASTWNSCINYYNKLLAAGYEPVGNLIAKQ